MNGNELRNYLNELDHSFPNMSEDQRAVMSDKLDRWSLLLLEMAIRMRCGGLSQPAGPEAIAMYCQNLAERIESGACRFPYDPELM